MPIEGDVLYKSREDLLAELQEGITALIPDAHLGEDGVLNFILQLVAAVGESVFLANQIVAQDMFITTANEAALESWGAQFAVPRKSGSKATGSLIFTGDGGVVIPVGSEVAADPGTGEDPLYYLTTAQGTVPNPGTPTAPTTTDPSIAGNLTGTFEYAVTFVTAGGETERGASSTPLAGISAERVQVNSIPIGGAGTTQRKLYRQKNGDGLWKLVATIADNTTTTYQDNIADGSLGGAPPEESTAERVTVAAESEESGEAYNVLGNTITTLTSVPDGVVSVTNGAAFSGGTDEEPIETYRDRLLRAIRSPSTGSAEDLRRWAEEIDGVETATVYSNDNLGVPTNGHATVRISGPGGSVPGAPVVTAVQSYLESKDLANITIHVDTYVAVATNISVGVVVEEGFELPSVQQAVVDALTDFLNSMPVGETLRVSAVIATVLAVPGIVDVTVSVPAANVPTDPDEKRIPGDILVA